MREVYVLGPCRTAIGTFGGSLKDVSAIELGIIVMKESMKRAGIKPEQIEEVMFGNVVGAGLGQTWPASAPSTPVSPRKFPP
jgi:acetyl-CoA C-acetyltransferase